MPRGAKRTVADETFPEPFHGCKNDPDYLRAYYAAYRKKKGTAYFREVQARHDKKHPDNPKKKAERIKRWQQKNRALLNARLKARRHEKWEEFLAWTREWMRKNPERMKQIRARAYEKYRPKAIARAIERKQRKRRAMPQWADKQAIQCFYDESRRMTAESGVKYVVDHIVPLKSKIVCGLHVAANLRIITAFENGAKAARLFEEIAVAPTLANGLLNRSVP